jgi:phospho-N-acetylmuramoyl-pentapeptide-transferase
MSSLIGLVVALIVSLLLCRSLRRSLWWLRSREAKAGKEKIHRLFPKPRRPLGGGLGLLVGISAGLGTEMALSRELEPSSLALLGLMWGFGLVGLGDDLRKTAGQGLSPWAKLALQAALGLGFCLFLRQQGASALVLPFREGAVSLGWLYLPVGVVVVVAASNAVNLADGVDGLAAGSLAISLAGLLLIGLAGAGRELSGQVLPLLGATLGFLVHNLPPARLLMGDTGALALGAGLGGLALFSHSEWLLPLVAAVFTLDALSVVAQVGTVRLVWRVVKRLRHRTSESARPFLCAPVHHHFQWLGWSDRKVLLLFWGTAAFFAALAPLALRSDLAWLAGLVLLVLWLTGAAVQKAIRASYFLGVQGEGSSARVVVYRGLPVEILGRRLYRPFKETAITEEMLAGVAAESLLWRPLTELEVAVLLGRVYAEHRMLEQALAEWEQVPRRNLALRENVLLQMARIYYRGERLLEAIRLWESLPGHRLARMPNLREAIRGAKLRLADLAIKSYRQVMRSLRAGASPAPRALLQLETTRAYNQDLLDLLQHEEQALSRRPDTATGRRRSEAFREAKRAVAARLAHLRQLRPQLAQAAGGEAAALAPAGEQELALQHEEAARKLGVSAGELRRLLRPAGEGEARALRLDEFTKASRNQLYRLHLSWSGKGPATAIAKVYLAEKVPFHSACFRRERGVLSLLHEYGCPVPEVYGGATREDRALLLMEDVGEETLAEHLEAAQASSRQQLLGAAVGALIELHSRSRPHLETLAREVAKIEKERLGADYYLAALRIALGRLAEFSGSGLAGGEDRSLAAYFAPLIEVLVRRVARFIHFELTTQHLLLGRRGIAIFDFEQATIGPPEFDLATLISSPEARLGGEGRAALVETYLASRPEEERPKEGERALPAALFFKNLCYAGAAANFYRKFGGEHHLQRLEWYLRESREVARGELGLTSLGDWLEQRLQEMRVAHG